MSLNHLIFHVENIHKYDFKQHEKLIWTGRKKKVDIWNANTLLLRQDYITFLSLLSQYPLYLHLVWIRNICEKQIPSITETGIIRFIGWHLISLFFHFSSDSVHFTNHLTVCFYYEAGRDREIARKFEILDRQNIDWIKRIKNIRINQYKRVGPSSSSLDMTFMGSCKPPSQALKRMLSAKLTSDKQTYKHIWMNYYFIC